MPLLLRRALTRPAPEVPLAHTLALTAMVAFAGLGLVMAVVMVLVHPEPIPGIDASQRQSAETALYALAMVVVAPVSLVAGPWLAEAVARRAGTDVLGSLTGLLTALLAATVVGVRLLDVAGAGGGMRTLAIAMCAWGGLAVALMGCAWTGRRIPGLGAAARHQRWVWGVAIAAVALAAVTATRAGSLDLPVLFLGVAVSAVVLAAPRRLRPPALRGRPGAVLDAALVALIALAVVDLVIVRPEDVSPELREGYMAAIMKFHHDFIAGPANQVLGGKPMLVDTASQYGAVSIEFVAGWFKAVGVGYGSFGLLDGVLTALYFATGYLLLRVAGVSRLLAAATLAVGVVALVYNRVYPVGLLPQEGPLRFGIPMVVIAAMVVAVRWPRARGPAGALVLVAVGLASVWSFEALAATALTAAATAALAAWTRPAGRGRWLASRAAFAVGAIVAAHLIFAALTLAAAGELPDWTQYTAFLREFLFGDIGNLTYDFSRWSPGLAVGGAYLAAVLALGLLLRLRPEVARQEPVATMAITGLTAYALALFYYFVDRSADHVAVYVSLPLLLLGALWLSLALRRPWAVPGPGPRGVAAAGAAIAAVLVSVAWGSAGSRLDHSALGHLVPGGDSPGTALTRLRDFPPIDDTVTGGERLVAAHMPARRRIPVLVSSALTTELLMRQRPRQLRCRCPTRAKTTSCPTSAAPGCSRPWTRCARGSASSRTCLRWPAWPRRGAIGRPRRWRPTGRSPSCSWKRCCGSTAVSGCGRSVRRTRASWWSGWSRAGASQTTSGPYSPGNFEPPKNQLSMA